MPQQNIFQSGTIQNTAGTALPTQPQISGTFTKSLQMRGKLTSIAVGSYDETSLTRPVWVADAPAQVVAVYERHSVIGSTAGMLVQAVGSTPLGSGAPVLSATIALTNAVDVTQSGVLLNSTTLQTLAKGDALGWQWATPGALPPVGDIEVVLEYI